MALIGSVHYGTGHAKQAPFASARRELAAVAAPAGLAKRASANEKGVGEKLKESDHRKEG